MLPCSFLVSLLTSGCDFGSFFRKCRCVGVFSLWVFQALQVVESAGRRGVGWKWGTGFDEVGKSRWRWIHLPSTSHPPTNLWSVFDAGRTF